MTTIEQYLRNRIIGYELPLTVIEDVCQSPIDKGMDALFLGDNAYDSSTDFIKRRDYAEGTLYYLVTGMFSTGGYKKTIENKNKTSGNITI